ncbi:type II toxin-antitoxin system VapC family toxin [Candidatus Desulforudis audaxviator]|uniref:PIN domain-containing protein n=1 Tax=Desulforudis audaxviator (strain MP104C) TaxID=477974 RepID=B1I1K7_DESAP|nr:type II toxin-antitoxin system VapC family toxin [Candidatus Desulforudis audaxviator]ACA58767.1 conserved hypothetical protein [Candidatus Desulforudis audaxviator MP104C]AZK58777.1 hypothetical protein Daudx_0219 [Candidatus Desulforudis audaxviator]
MILYLDTSALVKLYIREEGSEVTQRLLAASSVVATSKVAYAEARAALARAYRDSILDNKKYTLAVSAFRDDWDRYFAVEVSDMLIGFAGDLAEKHSLRGFDAIHLASILTVKRQVKSPLLAACWDARLWDAIRTCGIDVIPEVRPVQRTTPGKD